ncbi:alpha/beta fold hydrolase [Caenimonas koreensis]|uniref:Alpha/beta fold hydrolase n=1 Tax=Caenimonas koreensis DSM 17982 TaxID=1121255 RepID=A0A844AP26_9BURK|nr:alpha/beta hydrolase [Caenimonas koreensis]MRD45735.1 alpha/beta fold hydrolase [Caenimonas koreensis DSM 17982]
MTLALPPALRGDRFEFDSQAGRLSAYVTGEGPPLLLIHSINASASAAEMRPLHEHYSASRTVFCVDLPGYGFSDRSDRNYTPQLMTDAIHAITEQIRTRCKVRPVDALALSLSCEYLARAAAQAPEHFRTVALVSPTGFRGHKPWRAAPGTTRGKPWLYKALHGPGEGWGEAVFRGLTRPGVIRYFLRRTWGAQEIDETLWAYDVLTTKAPGAHHAPLHFLSAQLFSADIHTIYEQLTMPVWMSHGVRGDFTDYRGKAIVEKRPNWQFSVFPTGALPYFEVPDSFIAAYDRFLSLASAGPGA